MKNIVPTGSDKKNYYRIIFLYIFLFMYINIIHRCINTFMGEVSMNTSS